YKDKYGSLFFSWLGPIPFVIVTDPQLIQDILKSPHCINKSIIYKGVDDTMGHGLFSKSEPLWSEHRKLLNPAFGHKMLLSFLPIFNAETASLLKMVDPLVDSGGKNLIPLLQGITLNTATRDLLGAVTDMIFSPWLLSKTVRQILGREEKYSKDQSQMSKIIAELIDLQPENKNIFLNIANDLMIRGIFSAMDVQYESRTIVFAAFETTANTVAYTLILLAMFPEYQEKAFEEIRSLFPSPGDFEVTYEDTQNMAYMDLILNESMRVLTPVPIVARQTMQDVLLSNGIVIPKGVQVAIDIFHLHRDKKIWGDDAETFNPEHFLSHHMQDKHPYSYIPFTKGIRNCIGWRYALISAKVTLGKLLRNYKLSTSFKFEDLDYVEDITLKLTTMPLLEIQKRTC
ncbi:hypothetical protein KR044_010584, partial [Drosophila immigrans]